MPHASLSDIATSSGQSGMASFDDIAPKQGKASVSDIAATHYDSLAPSKKSSWWEEAEEAIVAPIRESSIGRAFHQDTLTEAAKEADPRLKEPSLVRFSEAHPEKLAKYLGGDEQNQQQNAGALSGGAHVLESVTSPENLAIMAATMGLGKVPGAAFTLSRVIGAGFTFQMVKSAADMSPKLMEQIKIGDHEGAAETLTEMAGSLGMAASGLSHVTRRAPVGLKPPPPKNPSDALVATKTGKPKPTVEVPQRKMTREELIKWHEDFETAHPDLAGNPPETSGPDKAPPIAVKRKRVNLGSERGSISLRPKPGQPGSEYALSLGKKVKLPGGYKIGDEVQWTTPTGEVKRAKVSGYESDDAVKVDMPGASEPIPRPLERIQRVGGEAKPAGMDPPPVRSASPRTAPRVLLAPPGLERQAQPAGKPGAPPPEIQQAADKIHAAMQEQQRQNGMPRSYSLSKLREDLGMSQQTFNEAIFWLEAQRKVHLGDLGKPISYEYEKTLPSRIEKPDVTDPMRKPVPTRKRYVTAQLRPEDHHIEATYKPSFQDDRADHWSDKFVPEIAKRFLADEEGSADLGKLTRGLAEKLKPADTSKPNAAEQFLADEEGAYNPNWMKDSTEELWAKMHLRKHGLKALKDAEIAPLEKAWGKRFVEWFSGDRNVWVARTNQAIEVGRKILPDRVDREALLIYRDFKNRPGELQKFLDGTHPDIFHLGRGKQGPAPQQSIDRISLLKPQIEKALNPTPAMLKADAIVTQIAEISYVTGKKLGILKSNITPESYTSHMLIPPERAVSADIPTPKTIPQRLGQNIGGKIGRKFEFARSRKAYDTILHAVADGAVPRTMDAFDAMAIYSDRFATARTTKLAMMRLKDAGLGMWASSRDKVPESWVPFAWHSNEFVNHVPYMDAGGEPAVMEQRLYVAPEIEQAMRPITDPDWTNRMSTLPVVRQIQQTAKAGSLSLSLFHPKALAQQAFAAIGPSGQWKSGWAEMSNPEMAKKERIFIMHDGMTDILGQTYEAYHHLKPTSIPTWDEILTSAPLMKQLHNIAAGITEFTFRNLQRKWKVWDFATKDDAWQGSHPGHTPEELTAARISIAKSVNAKFGGLNWEVLGWSKAAVQIARCILLAPDWSISNVYNVGYALQGGPKAAAHQVGSAVGAKPPRDWEGTAGSNDSRLFWAKYMVSAYIANQLMSYAVSGKWSPSYTQVFYGKDKDGQNILQNVMFTGAPGDLTNILNKGQRDGIPQAGAEWLFGKLAPGLRGFAQVGLNKNWNGRDLIPRDMDWRAKNIRAGAHMLRDVSGIPFSFQNMWDETMGADADKYTAIERFATVINGTPPMHVPPAGMHMTKKGLKPIPPHKTADLPWWDQAISGKVR